MINQTLAIFTDAYRELSDRKLFWITLILSGIAMLGFTGFHADDHHLTYMGANFPDVGIPPRILYKQFFTGFVIGFWLTFVATILALISTGSIFPDLVSGGSVDLFLSKPISRVRLFFTKYLAALLFVILQVLVFTVVAFFVLGLRGGGWHPKLFYAIPIVLTFFSYLFAISVFFGVLWRSTLAAIFLTILFWLICYSLSLTELVLLNLKTDSQLTLNRLNTQIDTYDKRIAMMEPPTPRPATAPSTQPEPRLLTDFKETRQRLRSDRIEAENNLRTWERWHGLLYAVKTIFPKTTETIGLLDRYLFSADEEARAIPEKHRKKPSDSSDEITDGPRPRTDVELQKKLRDRSISWIVGTSLLFEAAVLSLAAWIFHRRDF